MSSKRKTTATKDEAKPALVPKLRFPEFRGKAAWTPKLLGSLFSQREEAGHTNLRLLSLMDKEGIIPQEDSNRKNNSSGDLSKYLRVAPGDIAYNTMRMWEGRSALSKLEGIVSPAYTICCPAPDTNNLFFSYYFKTPQLIAEFARYSQGLVKDTLNLKYEAFARIPAATPCDPAEQHKIAECLSSVDELIAAQARKVDALKTHKKGLMQQLFPREGETQPRLRFPEFQNKGKWVKKSLSDLCNIKHGYAFESEFFTTKGEYVLLTPGNFFEEGGYRDRGEQQKYYTGVVPRDYVLAEGDMLVAMTEQAAGLLGSSILVPEPDKFLHNQRLGLVTRKPGIAWANEFFFHVFNTQPVRKAIHDTASGAKVRHTSPIKVGAVAVSVPTSLPEQQRIADCLSTLDDLITVQTQKLEALKTHKKGLMQQLFPSPEEVEA